jgi:hypothetical protein
MLHADVIHNHLVSISSLAVVQRGQEVLLGEALHRIGCLGKDCFFPIVVARVAPNPRQLGTEQLERDVDVALVQPLLQVQEV